MQTDTALNSFRLNKVLTIEDLTSLLKRSEITVRRFLKECDSFTSINKNARYYTLPDIPGFDSNGLWNYEGVFFSRHGNLKQTVIHLIEKSDMGLSANEIERMVGLSDNSSFVSTFKHSKVVKREIIGGRGTGRYIYFAGNRQAYLRQQAKRRVWVTSLPSDSDAISILVELVRHPHSSSAGLAGILCTKGKMIDQHSITRLLVHHGLEKKTVE